MWAPAKRDQLATWVRARAVMAVVYARAMVTGRGYIYRPGPEITQGYISIIFGVKYDFRYWLFMLIPNFLSGRSYLAGNECFF